jgi:hypothetical protein
MTMTRAKIVLVVATLLAATVACKKTSTPPGASPSSDASAQAQGGNAAPPMPMDAAPNAAPPLPAPVKQFQEVLTPIVTMPAGVDRAGRACSRAEELYKLSEAMRVLPAPSGVDERAWSTTTMDVKNAVSGLSDICAGARGGPEDTDSVQEDLDFTRKEFERLLALLTK